MTNPIDEYYNKLQEYEKKIVNFFVDNGKAKNVNEKFSTIYAYFYMRRQLTQKQLQQLTGYSAGSISQILNQLLAINMLRRDNIPGSHEKQYELVVFGAQLVGSISPIMEDYFKTRDKLVERVKKDLIKISQRVADVRKRGGAQQLVDQAIPERIQRFQIFLTDFSILIPILKKLTDLVKEEMQKIEF